jgi:hypothetical protein
MMICSQHPMSLFPHTHTPGEDCPGPGVDVWAWIQRAEREIADLRTQLVTMTQERDEARINAMSVSGGGCAYCSYGSPQTTFGELQEHIKICALHPLGQALARIKALEAAGDAMADWCASQTISRYSHPYITNWRQVRGGSHE